MQSLIKKSDNSIVITTRDTWKTPGEYCMPDYAVIEFACDIEHNLKSVEAIGDPKTVVIAGEEGEVYPNPTVTLEKVII